MALHAMNIANNSCEFAISKNGAIANAFFFLPSVGATGDSIFIRSVCIHLPLMSSVRQTPSKHRLQAKGQVYSENTFTVFSSSVPNI